MHRPRHGDKKTRPGREGVQPHLDTGLAPGGTRLLPYLTRAAPSLPWEVMHTLACSLTFGQK